MNQNLFILIETLYECDRAYSANTRNGGKYMKKIRKDLCLFLVLMMLITATPLSANASAFEDKYMTQRRPENFPEQTRCVRRGEWNEGKEKAAWRSGSPISF